jgi:hypothetical protein
MVTVVEGCPDEGCYDTRWLMGLWSTSLHRDPVGEQKGGLIYQGLRGKGVEESSGDGCLSL